MRYIVIMLATIAILLPPIANGFVPTSLPSDAVGIKAGTNANSNNMCRVHPWRHQRHLLSDSHCRVGDRSSPSSCSSRTAIGMGFLDFLGSKFLDSRGTDFVPLDDSGADAFGPGPLIVLYAFPDTIDDEELRDMISDGMPSSQSKVLLARIPANDDLTLTVSEALTKVVEEEGSDGLGKNGSSDGLGLNAGSLRPLQQYDASSQPCPVLYFSGVSNEEMMSTYRIIANEVYEETGGVHWAACAKVVPPALTKSMQQVLEEISSDHADAMRLQKEGSESGDGN